MYVEGVYILFLFSSFFFPGICYTIDIFTSLLSCLHSKPTDLYLHTFLPFLHQFTSSFHIFLITLVYIIFLVNICTYIYVERHTYYFLFIHHPVTPSLSFPLSFPSSFYYISYQLPLPLPLLSPIPPPPLPSHAKLFYQY